MFGLYIINRYQQKPIFNDESTFDRLKEINLISVKII